MTTPYLSAATTMERADFMGKYTKRKDGRYANTITIDGKKRYVYGKTQKELEDNKLRLQMEYKKIILLKLHP